MWQRILALIVKELTTLWKDPKMRRVLLVPPLVQVALFTYAASFDVTDVHLAIWNEDPAAPAAELVRRFAASPAFRTSAAPVDPNTAAKLIDNAQATAVLHISQTFSSDLLAGKPAKVQLLLDARRSNTALLLQGYASQIIAAYNQERAGREPLVLLSRDWFNPTLESKWFILPSLVAILSIIMAMLVSAMSLAREHELGTFEQLLVTPLRPGEIIIGKAVPALIVGLAEANIILIAAVTWFQLPFIGSLLLLQISLAIYLLAGIGVGLAISSIAVTQQQAILGVFIYAAPAVVISGTLSPFENMPFIFERMSLLDPIRYMIVIARGIFLQGMPLSIAIYQILPMAAIAFILLTLATFSVRRALIN